MTVMKCTYEGCECMATHSVRTVLGRKSFCGLHAQQVQMIEDESDRAESEMLEQP